MHMRLLIDEPLDGATNMARDAALLALLAHGGAPPTLRLYRWASPWLSLGRFQRAAAIDRAACSATGTQVVRRPSGGRALLHDNELTYALVLPTDSALGGGTITTSYQNISAGLCEALRRLGAAAALAPTAKRRPPSADRPLTAACYDAPAAFELAVAGAQADRQCAKAGSVARCCNTARSHLRHTPSDYARCCTTHRMILRSA